jgi:catalase (peroxidase I)
MLVERTNLRMLSVPERTVLFGGMRVFGANAAHSSRRIFTDTTGTLSNDFVVNLLHMSTKWEKSAKSVIGSKTNGSRFFIQTPPASGIATADLPKIEIA